MPEQDIEDAINAHANASVSGDMGATLRSMTPEGFAAAMALGNTSWNFTSYELSAGGHDGDDYIFDIVYETDLDQMRLRYRVRDVDGEWKVNHVERLP